MQWIFNSILGLKIVRRAVHFATFKNMYILYLISIPCYFRFKFLNVKPKNCTFRYGGCFINVFKQNITYLFKKITICYRFDAQSASEVSIGDKRKPKGNRGFGAAGPTNTGIFPKRKSSRKSVSPDGPHL